MRDLIRRAIQNTPAMNTLMISVIIVGLVSVWNLRREVFPEFELEIILVTVPYPGASPEEVEEGICQKIEEAVRSIDGIKKQTAVAKEGSGSLVLELETGVDVQKILNEVRSEIDRIPSFPLLAEDPEVKQLTIREAAIQVGVVGPESSDPMAELKLREVAERIRDDLIRLPAVSQANLVGAKNYQIDVELSEETLRRYGLTLQEVAQILRRENLELPGGTLRTDSQDVLIKGKQKGLIGSEIAKIPVVTQPNGAVLTVADLGRVRDEFEDVTSYTRIEGQPGLVISVDRTSSEDLLAMTDAVKAYVAEAELPPGYRLVTWGDRSLEVRDRMDLLVRNGAQGLVLVLLVLAVFLNLRLAWWVALGIPISILGTCAILLYAGHTLNMLTMFAFLMALGIVVDDAIVVGENIYTHRQRGAGFFRAALDGTLEVLPSVTASVATTIVAFLPLMFVTGIMGKFIAVLPLAMISMLLISLLESTFILPCHLAHGRHEEERDATLASRAQAFRQRLVAPMRWTLGWIPVFAGILLDHLFYPLKRLGSVFAWLNVQSNRLLDVVAERLYRPVLHFSVTNPGITISSALVILLLAAGLVRGGFVPFVVFPKLDSNTIEASVVFPDGTPASVTEQATHRLERAIRELNRDYEERGSSILRLTRRSVGHVTAQEGPGQAIQSTGGHLGSVTAELLDTSIRTVTSQQILGEWRARAGEFPGAERVSFDSSMHGPGGTPIEFKLLAKAEDVADLERAVEECKARLSEFPGVFDVADDSSPGKWEFQLRIKEDAVALGVPLADLAETVRASYYGEEVMRLQRGRHEVKLMVRYPREDRRSLADFEQIRIRTGDKSERPLTELADVRVERGYSEINRVDQLRSITISADVDEATANARNIVANLQTEFMPDLLARYPSVSVRWEGQQEQTTESVNSLIVGLFVALIGMFVLLTLEFRSYLQPLLILAIIPFGMVGAVVGHLLMGLPLTLFSLFGLVALTGVVVNDSIVLIDFINHQVRDGAPLKDALITAGRRRLRPIFLTSVTTVSGLLPLLMETSFQAQMLIPMAVSLCFGLLVTTVLVLFLIPTFYMVYARLAGVADAPGEARTSSGPVSPQRDAVEIVGA